MADIIDPLVISWDNTRTRTLADQMTRVLAVMQAYQADYAAFGINAAITTDGPANKVGDGYAVDGRAPITGAQIQNFKAAVDQLVTNWTTVNVAGVGVPPATIQQACQVNGSPR